MQAGIAHIKKELAGIYPETEINAFISIIFQHIKSYTRTQLLLARDEIISEQEFSEIKKITTRLKNHEPIQYILGTTEFWGLNFFCRPGVLIPRPETEELVNWILNENANTEKKILDIGTGTGCIPIALKKHLPKANIGGCDISETCLELAAQNARHNQLEVSFFKMDILHSESISEEIQYDILISNPPYVRTSEKQQMEANVLDYEPELALFVPDNDPLLFYRAILKFAEKHLKTNGKIYWEINEALGEEYSLLLSQSGYEDINLQKDIHGKDRMISAKKL